MRGNPSGGNRRLLIVSTLTVLVTAAAVGAWLGTLPETMAPSEPRHAAPPRPAAKPPPVVAGADREPVSLVPRLPPRSLPAWRRFAVAAPDAAGRPMIAVVIDDLGMSAARAAQVFALDPPLTLAFLPYADGLPPMVADARSAGHEIMLHLPMEPVDASENPGPQALLTTLDGDELRRRIRWNFNRIKGYVGVNNHMGSRFTGDAALMAAVMAEISARGLLFLDSRTVGTSVALDVARGYGVPAASRDVFLDNDRDAARIAERLAEAEVVARRNGQAVVIGHPHPTTLAALRQWLLTLAQRGFVLVPVSRLVAVEK